MKFNDLEELKDEKKVQEAGKLYLEGKDYLMQFLGTEHWFSSEEKCLNEINELLFWLERNNNNISELIDELSAR